MFRLIITYIHMYVLIAHWLAAYWVMFHRMLMIAWICCCRYWHCDEAANTKYKFRLKCFKWSSKFEFCLALVIEKQELWTLLRLQFCFMSSCHAVLYYCSRRWLDIPELLLMTCLLVSCLVGYGLILQNLKCQILMFVTASWLSI